MSRPEMTPIISQERVEEALRVTLDNAKRFLKDSRILQKRGSTGHATSLVILGYEEAHKAYLLTLLHPIFDRLVSEEYRSELKTRLRNHSWKQIYAKEFRVVIEVLLESGEMSDEERKVIGIPPLSELRAGTDYAISAKLDRMKNNGFYSDPFAEPVWSPSKMDEKALEAAQKLLKTHIKSIEKTVKMVSRPKYLPDSILESAISEMRSPIAILEKAEVEGVTTMDELSEELGEYGAVERIIGALAKASVDNERLKQAMKEKRKASRRTKPKSKARK